MTVSRDLALAIQDQDGPAFAALCNAAAAFRSEPQPPTTFTLAPDHRITIDENGATVWYGGEERHVRMSGSDGLIALPIRHTPLDVTRPVPTRRHFIQFFLWVPSAATDPPTWTLGWILYEVVGLDFVPITGERELTTITAARPPATIDVASLARVYVNANGEAEWIISGGPNPRSGVAARRDRR